MSKSSGGVIGESSKRHQQTRMGRGRTHWGGEAIRQESARPDGADKSESVFAGQNAGVRRVGERIWLVTLTRCRLLFAADFGAADDIVDELQFGHNGR